MVQQRGRTKSTGQRWLEVREMEPGNGAEGLAD